jgi:hypothetical protein
MRILSKLERSSFKHGGCIARLFTSCWEICRGGSVRSSSPSWPRYLSQNSDVRRSNWLAFPLEGAQRDGPGALDRRCRLDTGLAGYLAARAGEDARILHDVVARWGHADREAAEQRQGGHDDGDGAVGVRAFERYGDKAVFLRLDHRRQIAWETTSVPFRWPC